MNHVLRVCVAILSAGFLSAAGGTQALADNLRIDEAWKAALMDFEGVLNEKQHATVNLIAYSAAAGRLCDGLDIDVDKVNKALTAEVLSTDQDLNNDEHIERLSSILLTLGTAKGIFLAEGALHKEQFCKEAMAAKAEKDTETFWK